MAGAQAEALVKIDPEFEAVRTFFTVLQSSNSHFLQFSRP